jgi:hypothetical protein
MGARLAGERPSFRRMVWRRAGSRPYDAALISAVATFPTRPGIAPFVAEDRPCLSAGSPPWQRCP